jgi:serine protease
MRVHAFAVVCLLAVLQAVAQPTTADERNPAREPSVLPSSASSASSASSVRIIVKFRPTSESTSPATSTAAARKPEGDPVAALAAKQRIPLRSAHPLAARWHVLDIDTEAAGESVADELERMRADPSVEYAERDVRRYPHAVPDDLLYPGQWYLQSANLAPSAIDAEAAWDVSTGSAGVVVADIDTGVLFNHPDLLRAEAGGRLLPGYDFVSDVQAANDGDGRDPDPSDPGDWVTSAETTSERFEDCRAVSSSWHGTRVAGILGARTNNSSGIAGVTWSPWVLPVRALGKCGGFDSDILPAILWAAGFSISGVPDNPYPARIVNLSIGAAGACPPAYQDLVDELGARGVLVVASAGNEGGPVDAPANCLGVVGVAGLRQAGTKVGFSSLGPEVALGAPAGNCVNLSGSCLYPINTTYDTGTTGPASFAYTDQIDANVGTSFSAPIVSAIAALMVSVNGNLDPAALRARLQEGAATFPASSDPAVPECHVPAGPTDLQITECSCTTSTCGAGMARASGALQAALRPIAAVAVPETVSPGQDVELSASGSTAACGHAVTSYAWTVVDGGTSGVGLSDPSGPTTTVVAPAEDAFTVRLTVTDDAGAEDTADILVSPSIATTAAPASGGGTACLAEIPRPEPPNVTVTISPAQATLQVKATQAFAAEVTNAADTSVRWQVNGIDGGTLAVGTISSTGVYTAPPGVPSPNGITVTAISSAYPNAKGSAQVTVVAASSGGGGSFGAAELLGLLLLIGVRRRLGEWPNPCRLRCRMLNTDNAESGRSGRRWNSDGAFRADGARSAS